MPQFDGTGPMSEGPMTGRGMGSCGGGQFRGRRRGYGWRRCFDRVRCPFWNQSQQPPEVSDKDKVEYLQDEAESIKIELKAVESELDKLSK